MENNKGFKRSQYACAVLLIVSSIVMVAYQVIHIDDVANGLLYYVAQSFLLAGSIFGLDQYIRIRPRYPGTRSAVISSLILILQTTGQARRNGGCMLTWSV